MKSLYDRWLERRPLQYIAEHQREQLTEEIVNGTEEELDEYEKRIYTRRVVCAANVYWHEGLKDGRLMVIGVRHSCPTMNKFIRDYILGTPQEVYYREARRLGNSEQGFIDNWGTFMSRKEALMTALVANQTIYWDRAHCDDELYSEMLY